MKADDLIQKVLIDDIRNIQKEEFHYPSFFLMAAGIEFLGACLDCHDFNKHGLSEERFKKAIEELFPEKYKEHAQRLYTDLRCSLLHIGIPGENFGLTREKESDEFKTKHLEKSAGKIVLISEKFYKDFEEACNKVINNIKNGKLIHAKLKDDIFMIPGEKISNSTGISAISASTSGCNTPSARKM